MENQAIVEGIGYVVGYMGMFFGFMVVHVIVTKIEGAFRDAKD